MRKFEFLDRFMVEPYRPDAVGWQERSGDIGGPANRFFWRVGLLMLVAMGLPFGA